MRDAEAILKIAGEPTIIKIPSTTGGIRAMQKLSADVDICATQVMSTLQGMCALQSGVKYISVFYCFMLMGGADDHGLYGGVDAKAVFAALNKFIQVSGSPARIMACAPRTPDELSYLMSTGATSVALDPEDFENCFNARLFINLNQDVRRSWEAVFGNVGADELDGLLRKANEEHAEIVRLFELRDGEELQRFIRDVHWSIDNAKFLVW